MARKRILSFVDKWIGLECAVDMVRKFPDDIYTFLVGPHGRTEALSQLAAYDVRELSDDAIAELRAMQPGSFDWLLNLWGHSIFRKEDLILAHRSLNIHPGMLPNVRGSDPVVWTIRRRLEAGASLHEITLDIDAGPIYCQASVPYSLPIKGGELYEKVVRQCIDLFRDKWPVIRESAIAHAQTGAYPTFRRSQLNPDRRIDFDETISRLLAHDFSDDYRAIVNIDGVDYHASLQLVPLATS